MSQTHAADTCQEAYAYAVLCCADFVVRRLAMPNIDWSDISTDNMSTLNVHDFVTTGHVCFCSNVCLSVLGGTFLLTCFPLTMLAGDTERRCKNFSIWQRVNNRCVHLFTSLA